MRKTASIPLLMAGLACGAVAVVHLSQALSGPVRTELYADQENLRLTIAKVGRETDFLLPSVQEQAMARQQAQAQRAAPARFRPGEPYFVVRGFIEDRTGQTLSGRLGAERAELIDESGRKAMVVQTTHSALRAEPSLSRIYEPSAQGQAVQQQRLLPDQWASNTMSIRSRAGARPATQDAFLPKELLAFAAFFRALPAEAKRIELRYTILDRQVRYSPYIRFEDVTLTNLPQEQLAGGYRVAIEKLELRPISQGDPAVSPRPRQSIPAVKDQNLFVHVRVAPAAESVELPSTLGSDFIAPLLVEDEMADRVVCEQLRVEWKDLSPDDNMNSGPGSAEQRQTWVASYIDRNATRFTITMRLNEAGPPTKREFVIRDIPVP